MNIEALNMTLECKKENMERTVKSILKLKDLVTLNKALISILRHIDQFSTFYFTRVKVNFKLVSV